MISFNMPIVPKKINKVALIYPVKTFMPPLGLMTITTVLRKLGKEVAIFSVFDYEYIERAQVPEHVLDQLRRFAPDMIGIGFMSAEWLPGKVIIERLSEVYKDVPIVAGGRHPSSFPQDVLQWGADYVVVGEGETTITYLIDALEAGNGLGEIHGLSFFDDDGKQFFKPGGKEKADLDIVPAYDIVPYQNFIDARLALVGRYVKAGWLSTSRGCFSKCIYCRDPNFGKGLRFRSLDSVKEDIKFQSTHYDLTCFLIIDEMFAIREQRVLEFCNMFIEIQKELNRKLHFAASARIDTLTESMVEAMKAAGCIQLSFGLESGSQRIHDFLQTNKNVETATRSFSILKGSGIDIFVNLIVGVPGETEYDIRETLELIKRFKPETVGVSYLTAYPGTPLFEMALEKGWLKQSDLDSLIYKHTFGESQLHCGIEPSVLKRRKQQLYNATLRSTMLNLFKGYESIALIRDMLLLGLRDFAGASSLIKSAFRFDIDKAKEIYRLLLFRDRILKDTRI
ncbi:B12-binding domain-containing radical SAM protein [Candidatus Magnetomonas plexicatena]|uniref:B12-binding domain-containing radical SAM protein n=1 Tax=Candidatus Magnetomonas plexicatena TaxID=2552947 RepID=UPI0011038BA4|nr:B12-binding domain-containing radical SAM protein [Nitrospirales bacterium LBB_01]